MYQQESPNPVSNFQPVVSDLKCLLEKKRNHRPSCPGLSGDGADPCGHPQGWGTLATWPQDRRVPGSTPSGAGLCSRVTGPAGKCLDRRGTQDAAQPGSQCLLPPAAFVPGAGNETLWLVTNQTVFGIQQEEVPRVGASVVSHLSPSPLTLRCCSTQRRGEGWVSGTLEPEGTLDRPGLRAV